MNALAASASLFLGVPGDGRGLKRQFGKDWDEYAARVRRWLPQ
jgi:protein-S-isoprenylcysteine O-methyltransferase Ste14